MAIGRSRNTFDMQHAALCGFPQYSDDVGVYLPKGAGGLDPHKPVSIVIYVIEE